MFSQIREMFSYLDFDACVVTCGTCMEGLDAIETGFNKLPEPHPTEKGWTDPVHVGAASAVTHAVQQQQVAAVALPAHTGNAGKFLSTNGTIASWETVPDNAIPMAIALG